MKELRWWKGDWGWCYKREHSGGVRPVSTQTEWLTSAICLWFCLTWCHLKMCSPSCVVNVESFFTVKMNDLIHLSDGSWAHPHVTTLLRCLGVGYYEFPYTAVHVHAGYGTGSTPMLEKLLLSRYSSTFNFLVSQRKGLKSTCRLQPSSLTV